MQIGVHYSRFPSGPDGSLARTLAETARVADQGGVELFTLMDHYFQMEVFGGPPEPMLEGYTGLGYVAALTERIRLGLLVTGVTYRHPGVLAKTVTTLDTLSGGRAQLGIGAAWYRREHEGLGIPFPPLKERFERLEETLQVCRAMFRGEDGAFEGRHYRLEDMTSVPAAVHGDIPILVGGSGERKTLRLVAQYADACNVYGADRAEMAHKLGVLKAHCEGVGREYDDIRKTVNAPVDLDPLADPDGFVRQAEEWATLGFSMITLNTGDDPVRWTTGVVERILPRIEAL